MKQEKINAFSEQAGEYADHKFNELTNEDSWVHWWRIKFAELVRNDTLEESAKVCEAEIDNWGRRSTVAYLCNCNQEHEIMKTIIAYLLAALLVYFGFSFAHWGLYPSEWSFNARALCATCMFLSGVFAWAGTV